MLKNCDCVDGCPACIYSPKCGNDNKPLHKKATKHILGYMCSKMDGSKSKVKEKSNWKGETIVERLKAFRKHPFQVKLEKVI